MLRKWRRGVALAVLVSLMGCVPSLHPLYTDQDCVFNPALVALWQAEGAKDSWAFTKRDDKSYNLVYTDDNGVKGNLVVHLIEIQGITFMDLFPGEADPALKINGMYALHFVPCHFFARVGDIGPDLQLAFTHPEWTQKFLTENPTALKHEIIWTVDGGERLVLTASTAELQKFWVEHARTAGAFTDPIVLKWQAQPPAATEAPKDAAK